MSRIKGLINEEVSMGTYGLVELELKEYEKEILTLKTKFEHLEKLLIRPEEVSTKKRTFKCNGCGEARPCIIESNQESGIFDDLVIEGLKCVLDETNQTGYNWKELYCYFGTDKGDKTQTFSKYTQAELSSFCERYKDAFKKRKDK